MTPEQEKRARQLRTGMSIAHDNALIEEGPALLSALLTELDHVRAETVQDAAPVLVDSLPHYVDGLEEEIRSDLAWLEDDLRRLKPPNGRRTLRWCAAQALRRVHQLEHTLAERTQERDELLTLYGESQDARKLLAAVAGKALKRGDDAKAVLVGSIEARERLVESLEIMTKHRDMLREEAQGIAQIDALGGAQDESARLLREVCLALAYTGPTTWPGAVQGIRDLLRDYHDQRRKLEHVADQRDDARNDLASEQCERTTQAATVKSLSALLGLATTPDYEIESVAREKLEETQGAVVALLEKMIDQGMLVSSADIETADLEEAARTRGWRE